MKRLVLLVCFGLLVVSVSTDEECEGVHIRGKFHKKQIIVRGVNRPYQLASFGHAVYFSYNVGNDDVDEFEVGYVTKYDTVPIRIPAVRNGFATALDEEHKLIYIGGSDGIFADDLTKANKIQHVIKGRNIWDMFYKEHLYFIEYPSQRLHKKVENGSELVEHISEKIYQFAIDGDEDIFITTDAGLHLIKNGTTERISYTGPKAYRAMEIDRNGVAHFGAKSTIYVANKHNHTLEAITQVKNVFGLAFDKDNNMIYSDPHEIIKLLPNGC